MKQIFAIAVIAALLGGCSDLNPFGSDTSTADSKAPAATAPKRVVIARLEQPPKADPTVLSRIAPAARADDVPDQEPPADPDAGETPKADEDFVNYLNGKKTAPLPARRTAAAKKTAAADPNHFELDKIAPAAGPGRRPGQIDDAYSADRDFIKVLMTDTKPVRKRARRAVKPKRVARRPSARKRVVRKSARKAPRKAPRKSQVIRINRTPTPAATKKITPVKPQARRAQPAARRTTGTLATLDGAAAADREVLKVLGGQ